MVIAGPSTPYHCQSCGKTYAEHADEKDSRFTARMPCLGIKAGFLPDARETAAFETRRARASNECNVPGCFVCTGKIGERKEVA